MRSLESVVSFISTEGAYFYATSMGTSMLHQVVASLQTGHCVRGRANSAHTWPHTGTLNFVISLNSSNVMGQEVLEVRASRTMILAT